jgi:hypothetical protein
MFILISPYTVKNWIKYTSPVTRPMQSRQTSASLMSFVFVLSIFLPMFSCSDFLDVFGGKKVA